VALLNGHVGRFQILLELDFDTAFLLAVLSGILYSIYLLISKVLAHTDILSFMTLSLLASTTYLGIVCLVTTTFSGFQIWVGLYYLFNGSLPVDGLVIGKFYDPTHACYKSFIKFAQAVITSILAWLF
jgi:hypothetical protein